MRDTRGKQVSRALYRVQLHEPMCIRINSPSLPLCLPPISQPEERKVEFKIFTVVAQVFRPEKLTFWGMIQFRFPFIFFQPVVKTAYQLLVKLLFESRFRRVIEISSANTTESLSFLSFLSFDQRTEISTLTCENTFLHLFKKKKKASNACFVASLMN